MGWDVRIHEYVAKVVTCGETDCDFRGTPDLSNDELQKELDEHYAHHSRQYRLEQEAIERENEGYSEMAVERIRAEVDKAFADVEADFPEAEPGWEMDVARTVILSESSFEADQREVFRRMFGCEMRHA